MRAQGFTLIELMIAVAIVGIIAAIAIPSYSEQVKKSKRADAANHLGDMVLRQERWRTEHPTFGTRAEIGVAATTADGHYDIAVSTPASSVKCSDGTTAASSANSYILTATSKFNDTNCEKLIVTSLCGSVIKSSTPQNKCW